MRSSPYDILQGQGLESLSARTVNPKPAIAEPVRQKQRPSRRRILLSLGPLALPDQLLKQLQGEAGLWRQEIDLYKRQAGQYVQERLKKTGLLPHRQPSAQPTPLPDIPMDPDFAAMLLAVPLRVVTAGWSTSSPSMPGWDESRFRLDLSSLKSRELPYFRKAEACGHCGQEPGAGAGLADRRWFDFQSYIQYKALARQMPADQRPAEELPSVDEETGRRIEPRIVSRSAAEHLRYSLGRQLLQHLQATAPSQADRSLLQSSNPSLNTIRPGVRVILDRFQHAGVMDSAQLCQFGISQDEDENRYVWERGEPAYLKYWMRDSATQLSSAALRQEEGFSQDYIAGTIEAYLEQCGVYAYRVQHSSSIYEPALTSEQMTLRRLKPLPNGEEDARLFELDGCPNGQQTSCY
ncbi:hypothetical protein WJX74_007889 [Apatococcus lobatus]|uniref:Uncharacterized protein n=1 Tax=Apatococcus lobatus TaxID=904363 RepID=A0AAW1SAS5_9CHLO